MAISGRLFIARHGETVFNACRRMQGQFHTHTPLTRAGFAQADAMGEALARWLGTGQALELWSSTAGRALQTMAVIAEHIGADWHMANRDDRLQEIDVGDWSGRTYAEIQQENGAFLDMESGVFTTIAPGGESYGDVATRLQSWLDDLSPFPADRLVVMHGMSSRVLRGLLLGLEPDPRFGVPIAPGLPQGSLVMIGGGVEKVIRTDSTGDTE
ncbi:MAG: histidine phosphatase family protein [Sphingopyxis sp.]